MSTGRGGYFAIDRSVWAKVCDCGMNPAVAYLVLALGTGPENKFTSWSTTSIAKYGGIGIERAKSALDGLIRDGIIRRGDGHSKHKPRYELVLPRQNAKSEDTDERIWLPNTLVTGTDKGETPPVHRLRSVGDLWALRLFVDLYYAHNLRDDGGIKPQVVKRKFDRKRVGEYGHYNIWGFRSGDRELQWIGPFAAHKSRPKPKGKGNHPVWESLEILEQMGLITFVPHIYENDSPDAEAIHPYGIGNSGGEPIEREIGDAADTAAREMAHWGIEDAEEDGFGFFCPVLRTLPNVQMIGIARLRYRPHTRRTSAWFAQLQTNGRMWLEKYQEINAQAEGGRMANFNCG